MYVGLSVICLNPLKPSGYFVYQYICQSEILSSARRLFLCFVVLRTAIISVHSINLFNCITETECVCCMVPTESLNNINFLFWSLKAVPWLGRLVAGLSTWMPEFYSM